MKIKLFAVLLIYTLTLFSQNKKATLYLKDSTKLHGFAKINSYSDNIKFRVDKNTKAKSYNSDVVEKIFIEEHGDDIEYRYKLINADKSRPYLLVLRIEGEISLYEYYKSLPNDGGKKKREKNNAIGNTKTYAIPHYFLVRNNEEQATWLGIGSGLSGQNKFISRTKKIVADCPELVKKINKKTFERKNILKIVNYYNDNCTNKNKETNTIDK